MFFSCLRNRMRALRVPLQKLSGGGVVLCYHGITAGTDPGVSDMHVPTSVATEQLRQVGRLFEIVPLKLIVDRHIHGLSTRALAAVTFDDAYQSIARLRADPDLKNVPITVFATTGATVRDQRFWWDILDTAFAAVPPTDWWEFERRIGLPAAYVTGHGDGGKIPSLRPIRQWILAEHKGRLPSTLFQEIERLGVPVAEVSQSAMSLTELVRLSESSEVDVAVHTVTHPVLPLLEQAEQVAEIASSFATLSGAIPKTLPFLAYPYGLHHPSTWEASRKAGMKGAFTLGEGALRIGMAPEVLPRLNMSASVGGMKFLLRLSGRLDGVIRRRRGLDRPFPALPSETT